MQKTRTSSQKALRMSGNESLNSSTSKKVSRTDDQPGLVRMSAARPPRTTIVEMAAIVAPRRAVARFAAARSARRSGRSVGASAVSVRGWCLLAYWRTGASAASLIHCCSMSGSSPDDCSSSTAAETHAVSDESFSIKAPH
jgi:hypothetical protein